MIFGGIFERDQNGFIVTSSASNEKKSGENDLTDH